jgi:hypothetical protein
MRSYAVSGNVVLFGWDVLRDKPQTFITFISTSFRHVVSTKLFGNFKISQTIKTGLFCVQEEIVKTGGGAAGCLNRREQESGEERRVSELNLNPEFARNIHPSPGIQLPRRGR